MADAGAEHESIRRVRDGTSEDIDNLAQTGFAAGVEVRLSKALYDRSYDLLQIQQLLDFIDWLMVLDDRREAHFDAAIRKYEEEKTMPTMSPMQKRFMAKGAIEMCCEDILDVLNLRFGSVPEDLAEAVQQVEDGKQLRSLHLAAVQVISLDEFRRLL